jgi:hypothetical protein
MDENERDDSPVSYRLTRRRIVVGGTLIVGGLGLHSFTVATAAAAPGDADATPFMALSRLLIDHHLDEQVGHRLAAAMTAMTPELPRQIDSLLAIAHARDARLVEDFFDDIADPALKQTALAIISAWYVGVLVDAPDAEVFAYELALMYQPTRDVMTIPTYAISGPNGWTSVAPPLADLPKF